MRSSLQLRERRRAVSTYLEVFILIGIVTAVSALVYSATTQYEPVSQGPSIAVSNASVRQGIDQALERMVISNTGTVSFSAFTISTVGTGGGIPDAQFYVALTNIANSSSVPLSAASGTTGDSSITENATIAPGQSFLATITFVGASEFAVGQPYGVTVSSSGAQASLQCVAFPA
jgi:hypothetical protein